MSLNTILSVLCVAILSLTDLLCAHQGQETASRFTNEWAVKIPGGSNEAKEVAMQLGYHFAGPIMGFPDTYLMVKPDQARTHKRGFPGLTERLVRDDRVVWAEQQFAKSRQKRDFLPSNAPLRRKRQPRAKVLRASAALFKRADKLGWNATSPEREKRNSEWLVPLQNAKLFNDELWEKQWYLVDTRTRPDLPKLDLHVLPVYARGITGQGVRVTVLDDGVEVHHQDLKDNYDPDISYDIDDDDPDPSPRYDTVATNAHGTRCAGEIAMRANNHKCGVGVAFNAKIGGIRLLDGDVNDRMEGTALGWAHHLVDIYSASWGPNDDGMTVEGPGRLALEAMNRGVTQGRDGKGAIYVWASGNGGTYGDNCNCDGYVNSVFTLAIGSASERGNFPWYGERCASTMATAYSSGAYWDQMIATTDLKNTCTIRHTGTSAAAPLAAGIIALALEANPALTWRDVQHLVASSSEYAPLADNPGWRKNAAGFWVNTRFGFGLMNADELVRQAEEWIQVPEKSVCSQGNEPLGNSSFVRGQRAAVLFVSDGCRSTSQEVNFLEHVELVANIQYPVRGALELYLTSPAGTKVQVLSPRKRDVSSRGFENWRFMSVLTWGESPHGTWGLEVVDKSPGDKREGSLGAFNLVLHGTKKSPAYMRNGPRIYDEEYNRVSRKSARPTSDASLSQTQIMESAESDDIQETNKIVDSAHYTEEVTVDASDNESVDLPILEPISVTKDEPVFDLVPAEVVKKKFKIEATELQAEIQLGEDKKTNPLLEISMKDPRKFRENLNLHLEQRSTFSRM